MAIVIKKKEETAQVTAQVPGKAKITIKQRVAKVITNYKQLGFWHTWGKREFYATKPSKVVHDKVKVTHKKDKVEFIGTVYGIHFGQGELVVRTAAGAEHLVSFKTHKVELLSNIPPQVQALMLKEA